MRRINVLLFMLTQLLVSRAHAGELFVAGDTNIFDSLLGGGDNNAPLDVGNQRLLLNMLGQGKAVLVLDTTTERLTEMAELVCDYFRTVPGITASLTDGDITTDALTEFNLLIAAAPDRDFSTPEIEAMKSFLLKGGNILLTGENQHPAFVAVNYSVNAAITGLGSSLSLNPAYIDGGDYYQATILSDHFTKGVTTFSFAYTSQIDGGVPLFKASQGRTFIARETIVPEPISATLTATICGAFAMSRLLRRTRKTLLPYPVAPGFKTAGTWSRSATPLRFIRSATLM